MSLTFASNLTKMIDAGLGGEVVAPDTSVAIGYRMQYNLVSGPVASWNDPEGGLPVKIATEFGPIQAGSGNPSPENVRPISGRESVTVTRSGKNVLGGSGMIANALKCRGTASRPPIDETAHTVTIDAAQENLKTIFDLSFLKAATQYTLIFVFSKNGSNRASNMRVVYSDGSNTNIPSLDSSVETGSKGVVTLTTTSGKTVMSIVGINQANSTTIYCDECGIFEGVITAADFVPYTGQSVTVQLGQTVYGGRLDVTNGVLTVDRAMVDLGDVWWSKDVNQTGQFLRGMTNTEFLQFPKYSGINMCSAYKCVQNKSFSQIGNCEITIGNSSVVPILRVKDDAYDAYTADQFKSAMSGIQFCYELAQPLTVQLSPQTITSLLGQNNVWSDAGDVSVTWKEKLYTEGY